jgi:hypothetical protein
MVKSTKAISVLLIAAGLVGAIWSSIVVLRGSEIYDWWSVLFCLAFAAIAYLFRVMALWWYRLMYNWAHGTYPDA